ncbi:MAG TPA: hypothetical protein VFG75_10885 [Gaiella sp.]|nr:hypothetical protein [Gaiella sp.]
MKRAFLLLGAAVLLAGGLVGGWFAQQETRDAETVVETTTTTLTTTAEQPAPGLPAEVDKTRTDLLAAAETGDYAALRPFIRSTSFAYTFGDPVQGGPIAYWQNLEQTTDQKPLEALADVLKMPYTLSRGIYYWPFAYDVASLDDLTAHERELLAPLGPLESVFVEGTGYLGWRAGIEPDGTWVLFVAGD